MMSVRYYEVDLPTLVGKLRAFFERRGGVYIAVLFGSATRRGVVRDVDLLAGGVGLKEALSLAAELEAELGIPTDVIPLEEAPPMLVVKAMAEGVVVYAKDLPRAVEAYKKALDEAEGLNTTIRSTGKSHA